jgi:toxin ParE1/3/4
MGMQPRAGRLRPDIAPNIRSLAVQKFVIDYRIEDDAIVIVRILHGSRDQAAAFEITR